MAVGVRERYRRGVNPYRRDVAAGPCGGGADLVRGNTKPRRSRANRG